MNHRQRGNLRLRHPARLCAAVAVATSVGDWFWWSRIQPNCASTRVAKMGWLAYTPHVALLVTEHR
jgi:hypothetical protein